MANLVDDTALAGMAVVANNAMNRERDLTAYRRELGVDPLAELRGHGWLDLCCGSGRALAAVAGHGRVVGVDLVDHFAARPAGVEPHVAPLAEWNPDGVFDVITCVHGLH